MKEQRQAQAPRQIAPRPGLDQHLVAHIASDHFWELDENLRFRSISLSKLQGSGIDPQALIGRARWELDYLGMDEAKWAAHRAQLEAHQPFRHLELGLLNRAGEERWFLVSGDPLFDAEGRFTGYRGVSLDITQSKRQAIDLARLNTALRMLIGCNQRLARAPDEASLLRDICEVIVAAGEYALAWVGYLRDPPAQGLDVRAAAGAAGYLDRLRIGSGENVLVPGLRSAAISEERTVCRRDRADDSECAPWCGPRARHSLGACCALPLRVEGRLIGMLNVCSADGRRLDLERLKLLEELAEDLAFGVAAQRERARRARAEAALSQSEERLRLAVEGAHLGLYDFDLRSGEVVVSPDYARMLGFEPEGFHETYARWMERLHPDDRDTVAAAYRGYIEGRSPAYRVEFRQRTWDGSWKWILSSGKMVSRGTDGEPLRMLGIHSDIDREKRAQERVRRLTSLYAALTQTSQVIARADDSATLFHEVCRIAVEHGGLSMAWIGMIDAETQAIVPATSFGGHLDYLRGVSVSLDPQKPQGRGPTGTALRTGNHYVCNDLDADPAAAPWRSRAHEAGFNASAAFPLRLAGKVIGSLTLYAAQTGFFDAEIVGLLDEMAADIGHALDRFALEQEQVRAETELREGEARFRHLLASLDDVVWSATLDGSRMLYISEAAQRVYGWPVEAFVADPQIWLRAVLPADAEHVRAAFDSLLEVGHAECEYRIVRADGDIRWLHERRSVILGETGVAQRIAGTATDITSSKRSEEALRASEEQYRALANVAPVGVFRTDARGACVYVNRTWCEIAGMEEERALGRGWEEAIHPDERSAVMAEWHEAEAQGRFFLRECRFQRPTGAETWVIAQATAERNAAGEVTGHVGCVTDITERKAAEEALRASALRLEEMSRRVLRLQEDERRMLARELHDEVGQQLAALKLNLQALRRTTSDSATEARLADCIEIAETTISQIRDRALDLRPSVLDDLGLSQALEWYGKRQAQRSGCSISVLAAAVPPGATGEIQTALFRIAQESVNNAIRHGGARRIDISLRFSDNRGVLWVRDDGIGFDVALATVRGRADSGGGVGLPGMRERAELLGGTVVIRSVPGSGTRVIAKIPLEG